MLTRSLVAVGLLLAIGGASLKAAGEPSSAPGVVLVADGAGDYRCLTQSVRKAAADAGLSLEIEPAAWSHGYRRSLADQVDRAHIRAEGMRLAGKVLALREACPARPVYLMAHSAGAAVVLTAAQHLPPDSVERIVLLAPTVSAHADVRPALSCARQGMDVFFSRHDWFACLTGLTLIGTEGRLFPRVAGRVGFLEPRPLSADDRVLYGRLRQHCWEPSWQEAGHDSGHYGAYQQGFLHTRVLPLLATR